MCFSGDGVNVSQPLPLSGSRKHDVMDSTRLYSGNDSDFMEMTTCVGGLKDDDTFIDELESPIMEQENDINRFRFDAYLVDDHNKSTYPDVDELESPVMEQENGVNRFRFDFIPDVQHEDSDLSLTSCIGSGVDVCREPAPAMSVCDSYAPTAGNCQVFNKLQDGQRVARFEGSGTGQSTTVVDRMDQVAVIGKGTEVKDMSTLCFSPDMSVELGSDMELTQCLPLDVSAATNSIKSSSRWPFGKRQDGRRDRVARFEDNVVGESTSVGDERTFAETEDLDVSVKVDTAEFLMELNKPEQPVQDLLSGGEMLDPFSTSSLTSFMFPALPAPVPSCLDSTETSVANLATDEKEPDKYPLSNTEQSSEFLGKEADEDRGELGQFVSGSSDVASAAMRYEPLKSKNSIVEFSAVSAGKTDDSCLKLDAKQHQSTPSSFITGSASKAKFKRIAECFEEKENVFASTSVSSSVPAPVNQLDSFTSQAEKLSVEEVGHLSQLAEETRKVDITPASVVKPVQFGVSAIERLFAAKESSDVFANNSASVEDASVAVYNTDHVPTAEPEIVHDSQHAAPSTFMDMDLCGLKTSVSCEPRTSSHTETKAQKLQKNAVQNIAQPADELLTRLKLANSMPYQATPSASAHHSFRLVHSAVKQNSTSAFKAANKSLPLSLHRNLSASSEFQRYEAALDRTKELALGMDSSGCLNSQLGISGDSSRMDISAPYVELTELPTTSLVSCSLTENLDATKREEMQLQPVMSLKSPGRPSTSLLVDAEENNMDTSVAKNVDHVELLASVKSFSQPSNRFSSPPLITVAEPLTVCPTANTVAATDSVASQSDEQSQIEVMKNVNKLSLASPMASSRGSGTDVGMETSDARSFIEIPPVMVALKSSSTSSEENSTVPTTDVSQSSVFCSTESETSRSDNTHAILQDVEPVSVSDSQVCVRCNIFYQLCKFVALRSSSIFGRINEVAVCQAPLLLGWVTNGQIYHLGM